VLRRFFSGAETTNGTPDSLSTIDKLLKLDKQLDRSVATLKYLASALPGDVKGYVVRGNDLDEYSFEAMWGYSPSLLTLKPKHGPWREPGPRLISNLVQELFTPNDQELRNAMSSMGLRSAQSSLVVPIAGRDHSYGAMVLNRHEGSAFTEAELRHASLWGSILGEAQAQAYQLRRARLSLVEFSKAFVEAIEAQDFTLLGHAQRVTSYALAIGRALEMSRDELADLYFAGMLHDIGNLGGEGGLTNEDKDHPQRGANMIASSELLENASEGIRTHHENWDGTGFPLGLRKENIPLLGRIVAVADIFDLLSSDRGHALPLHEVEKNLEIRAGQELDPSIVSLFINILRQGKSTEELGQVKESHLPF
jgi:HD-GYP domain-containing protein (c-di-GMP phosphodiesterase class II)